MKFSRGRESAFGELQFNSPDALENTERLPEGFLPAVRANPVLRRVYHHSRWFAYLVMSGGVAGRTCEIDPEKITFGQLPTSQFPRGARRHVKRGDWDKEVIAIEEHTVYQSMAAHFVKGVSWEETPQFREALDAIDKGGHFRNAESIGEIRSIFQEWDNLYEDIRSNGFLSMRELQKRRLINNPCKRLDEITVNLSRDGTPILNDGWHRFCIAKILGTSTIPVRILVRHQSYKHWTPRKTS